MPGLGSDSAIRYHSICISLLIEISNDEKEQYNEDVLTAATILRFYEQIEGLYANTMDSCVHDAHVVSASTIDGHSETYLNAIQFIINTQQNESFYSYRRVYGPPRDNDVHVIPSVSLRHSACLIALRQEIWSAFLSQRPFRLPVCPSNDYATFSPANHFVWTNRILVWAADLLSFCFGNQSMTPEQSTERWMALKEFEQRWDAQKPSAFKPIYYREADPDRNQHFPQIWHMNSCQVAVAQHIELGRILLAVSDPMSVSRLGIGVVARNVSLEEELRSITQRLCGLAVSNPNCPPALVTAAVGISVCGEYFVNPGEQEALVKLLKDLQFQHAWPTEATVRALRAAWLASSQ